MLACYNYRTCKGRIEIFILGYFGKRIAIVCTRFELLENKAARFLLCLRVYVTPQARNKKKHEKVIPIEMKKKLSSITSLQ
jgi:hypothetical protein